MRYVVTGAAGFIGRHVSEMLLDSGHEVDGVDCFTDNYDPACKRANAAALGCRPGYRGHELDLASADLDELCRGASVVVHLAGQPGVRGSWESAFPVYVERNLTVSHRLLDAARRTGVDRVVMASSSSVYGNADAFPTTEGSPTRPYSPYGVTKLAMEHLARAYADNWALPVVLLRYFTVYGPAQRPDMAFHRFIAAVAAGEPVPVYGDGEQIRDFTYVADAAAATVAASVADLPPATVVNVAGGSSATVNEVLRLVGELVGREPIVQRLADQPGDVRRTGGSTELARRLLGWSPEVSLAEGLKHQVAHQVGSAGLCV